MQQRLAHVCRQAPKRGQMRYLCVAREVLKLDSKVQKLAAELKDSHSLLVFGRGCNYATALEAALKVQS